MDEDDLFDHDDLGIGELLLEACERRSVVCLEYAGANGLRQER
jgi:hypothetical protein